MNLFVLDECPTKSAQMQCDKHIVKMVLESGQMLSTAHRLLDGTMSKRPSKSGKTMAKYFAVSDSVMESTLYRVAHAGHPCTVWTMQSTDNYNWHYAHFVALCDEYSYRYGKTHMTDTKLRVMLKTPPANIPTGKLTKQPLAMQSNPECMFDNVVKSYRAYYKTKADRFKMVWSKRSTPDWFANAQYR